MVEGANFLIRQGELSDLPYIYEVCLKTGLGGSDASEQLEDRYMIGLYFAAPYFHYELVSCFSLIYKHKPVGYIIGVVDTSKYYNWMNEVWLPELRTKFPAEMKIRNDFEKFLHDFVHKDCIIYDFLEDYPSHLHIDILPVGQKKGFGKKLMNVFIDHLKQKGSRGLHLALGEDNTNALAFYNNIGFKELKREPGTVYMGIRF